MSDKKYGTYRNWKEQEKCIIIVFWFISLIHMYHYLRYSDTKEFGFWMFQWKICWQKLYIREKYLYNDSLQEIIEFKEFEFSSLF